MDLERSEEATTGQSCEALKVVLHLLRFGGAKSRPACAGVTLRFGGSLPSARISSSRDSTDATACCRKFHLEVEVGFDAILMRQMNAASAGSEAAICDVHYLRDLPDNCRAILVTRDNIATRAMLAVSTVFWVWTRSHMNKCRSASSPVGASVIGTAARTSLHPPTSWSYDDND